MHFTNRFYRGATIVIASLFALIGLQAQAVADELATETQPDWWQQDASLSDVFFIDAQHGWAVGSHGALLRTVDGGATWQQGNVGATRRSTGGSSSASLPDKIQRANQREWVDRPTQSKTRKQFSCHFESVWFANKDQGWAVGGYDLPGLNHSRAVVVSTKDGGQTWKELPHQIVPRLKTVVFPNKANLENGWAVGEVDPGTGSSLFYTSSSGSVWSSQESKPMPAMKRAVSGGRRFVVIDSAGQLGAISDNRFEYAVVTSKYPSVINDLVMTDARHGWAVGNNGMVVRTRNGGTSWTPVGESQLQPLQHSDFRSVSATGDSVWFGGTCGRTLVRLNRETEKVTFVTLPQSASINRIRFIDPSNGWAVGDFGTIFATKDGGSTWQLQRRGAARGAAQIDAIVFCQSRHDVPFEFLATQCAENGKRFAVRVLSKNTSDGQSFDAVKFACERLGVRSVEQISIPYKRDDGQSFLIGNLVQQIRHLRPTIVVSAGKDIPAVVSYSIEKAADAGVWPEQLAMGISQWQTRYEAFLEPELSRSAKPGTTSRFLPQLGMHLDDLILTSELAVTHLSSQQSFGDTHSPTWTSAQFYKIQADAQNKKQFLHDNPFQQLESAVGYRSSIAIDNLPAIRGLVQKRGTMERFIKLASSDNPVAFRSELRQFALSMVGTKNRSVTGIWLFQLADRLMQQDRVLPAIDCLELLAHTIPNHTLAPLSTTLLARHYSSSEHRHYRSGLKLPSANQQLASSIPTHIAASDSAVKHTSFGEGRKEFRWTKEEVEAQLKQVAEATGESNAGSSEPFDVTTVDLTVDVSPEALAAGARSIQSVDDALQNRNKPKTDAKTETDTPQPNAPPISDAELKRQRTLQAAQYFSRIGTRDPGLVRRTDFRFLQAHIVRQLGHSGQPGQNVSNYFSQVVTHGTAAELPVMVSQLESKILRGENIQPSVSAAFTSQRPHLDGLNKEAIWQGQKVELDSGGTIQFAFDNDHLYVFVECPITDQGRDVSPRSTRQRDGVLDENRIQIELDVDRDLASAWRIQVDQYGQVQESCDSVKTWNPKLFVAGQRSESSWTAELAVPLSELVSSSERAKLKPWLFSVHRSQRTEEAPQLLVFEKEPTSSVSP